MSATNGLLQSVVQSALGAAVGVVVGQSVGLLYKRFLRKESERVEQLVRLIEDAIGVTINIPKVQKGTLVNFSQYRKAFAAGAGVIVIGALSWVSTSTDLKTLLESVVPAPLVPLVGIVLGGIATVVAVYKTTNAAAPTVKEPTVTAAPVAAAVPTTTSPTALVSLLPAPTAASYL